ncbi:unknown [Ruminococcus sp. CAG:488]|nr:unknown [Ruminococcus sp. CAG:488]
MANIRIDNASDDVLKIKLDGEEYFIPEDGSITISPVEKGNHRLIACRAIRTETDKNFDSDKDNPTRKLSKDENSQYVQLKGVFEINVIASKSVWTVKKKPILVEKTGVDALFSGCELEITGGSVVASRQSFADENLRRAYLKKQLMGAFFPIGIGILIFTVLVLVALSANISGNPVTLGGREFTYPWTFGLAAIDLGFIGYFTAMLINIFSLDKRYR